MKGEPAAFWSEEKGAIVRFFGAAMQGRLPPGQIWAISPGGLDENPGLFRIDVTGVRILKKPAPPAFSESLRYAEQFQDDIHVTDPEKSNMAFVEFHCAPSPNHRDKA